jgi:[protein-PII] uridylyltransferase
VATISTLVRWHLLLAETATTRDPDDPATLDVLLDRVGDAETLALLTALTEADARAASPKAWSAWRSRLILGLAERARQALAAGPAAPAPVHEPVAIPAQVRRGELALAVEPRADGARVTVIAPDRVGLLADMAATFAVQRVGVRAARAWSQEEYAVNIWEVAEAYLDPTVLRERFEAISEGRLDPSGRLRPPGPGRLAPAVAVRPEASTQATVLEVRTDDRPGVVYLVAATLAALGIAVRSAHVDTLGPQAVDVFYLQEASSGALGEERAAQAAHAVRAALSGESN